MGPLQINQSTTNIHQDAGVGYDPLLQELVRELNATCSQGIPITLQIQAMLVSGVIINGREYYIQFAEHHISSLGLVDAKSEEVRKHYVDMAHSLYPRVDDRKGLETQQMPAMIHLADARLYTLQGLPITSGMRLWRGKIEAVSGFLLGRIEESVPVR
ncbi:hypothetical protein [Janthinobacterium sp. J1-1]|uniref:hypothetical protein n=1 Tax=unclassified Janthinobacterium TaxID=2610881 RepID=UPI002811661F|nr:hypothetical protein [Janthinobacterium sp. J1-1]